MPNTRCRAWRNGAAGAALGAAGLIVLCGTALAAPATPAPGTNLVVNGNFAKPGPAAHEGATPSDWKLVDLGAETHPYAASIGAYNAKGKYPPPAGNPDKSDIAVQVFYEGGSATGVEGIGGQESSSAFGSITQANNPQVSFSDAETLSPEATVADWAGSGLEIDFSSGHKTYSLIYLNPWKASEGTFSGKPKNTAIVKYVLGPTLKPKVWNTEKARALNTDIKTQFGLSSFKVSDVRFVNLEDTTSSASPYPNMTGYVADVAVSEGPAA